MKIKAPSTRFHRVLFDREQPFHQRRVESKVQYKRKNKHKQRDE